MPAAKVIKRAGMILLLLMIPSSVTLAEAKRGKESSSESSSGEEEDGFDPCEDEESDRCNKEAVDIFTMGKPTIGGSGCPKDSVQVAITEDGQQLSVFFDEFYADTNIQEGKYRDRKSCNVGIPVTVLPGWSIGIFQVDYRGYCEVPDVKRSRATFSAEYFFAGKRGARQYRRWRPGFNDQFTITDLVGAVAMSKCGGTEILRVNTAIYVSRGRGGHEYDDAYMEIDTGDVSIPFNLRIPVEDLPDQCFIFGIQTQRCDDDKSSDERRHPSSSFGQSRTVPNTYNLRNGEP